MSKATLYEHFANKEECILGLFDQAAAQITDAVTRAQPGTSRPVNRRMISDRIGLILALVEGSPDVAKTLVVEMSAAGPRAVERRDAAMRAMADQLFAGSSRTPGLRYASPYDAFGVVGAWVELVSRQLRRGEPETIAELKPVLERIVFGLLSQGERKR